MAALNGSYKYGATAASAAQAAGVPPELFGALVAQESTWNPIALSPKGAIGLAQLMPGTASDLGVNPWSPTENLYGGARYLAQQKDRFGNWRDALAAYNVGPNAKDITKGYGYADKILKASGLDFGAASAGASVKAPGGTIAGEQAAGSADSSAPWWRRILSASLTNVGFVLLAVALIAFGLWAMIGSAGRERVIAEGRRAFNEGMGK